MRNIQDNEFQLETALDSGNESKSEKRESSGASQEISGTECEWKQLPCCSTVLMLLTTLKTKAAVRPLVWAPQMF